MIRLTCLKLSFQLLLLFVSFNYSVTWMSMSYDSLIKQYSKTKDLNAQAFLPVMVVIMLQKLGAFGLSFLGLKILRILLRKNQIQRIQEQQPTSERLDGQSKQLKDIDKGGQIKSVVVYFQQEITRSYQIKFWQEFFLGFLLFLSIATFSYLQSAINIIYILIQKCISCLILYLMADHSKVRSLSLWKILYFLSFFGVVALSTLVKLDFNKIADFYFAKLGASLEQISFYSLIGLLGMTLLDIILYWKLWTIVNESNFSKQKRDIKSFRLLLISLHKTFGIIFSMTKYCLVLLFILNMVKGQLLLGLQCIWINQQFLYLLIQLAVFHFLSQTILFYALTKYNLQIFIILIMTSGTLLKAFFFFTRAFDIHTITFVLLIFFAISSINQQIDLETEQTSKNS